MTESQNHLPEEDINIIEEMARIVMVIEESKQNITSTQFNVQISSSSLNHSSLSSLNSSQYPPKYKAPSPISCTSEHTSQKTSSSVQTTNTQKHSLSQKVHAITHKPKNIYIPKYTITQKIISYLKKNKDDPNKYCATKCLGDFYAITNQRWKLGTVIAVEPMKVICLSMAAIDKKLKVTP